MANSGSIQGCKWMYISDGLQSTNSTTKGSYEQLQPRSEPSLCVCSLACWNSFLTISTPLPLEPSPYRWHPHDSSGSGSVSVSGEHNQTARVVPVMAMGQQWMRDLLGPLSNGRPFSEIHALSRKATTFSDATPPDVPDTPLNSRD